jgi:xeroderma pigmentosum group C-complementing protein
MAGRKRAAPGSASRSASSRQTRASTARDALPDVYRQMLTDAEVRPQIESPERPLKRRRRPGEKSAATTPSKPTIPVPTTQKRQESEDEEDDIQFEDISIPVPTVQTMLRDSDEEDDDDDEDEDGELQFENVDLTFPDLGLNTDEPKEAPKDLQLDLTARATTHQQKVVDRRKPINRMEKDRRVEIHKTHLLCLMSHAAHRNRWCNDHTVQKTLRKLLNREMIKYLNPGAELSQFGQTNSLKTGLQKAEVLFKMTYQVTERGLRRALWADAEEHLQNVWYPCNLTTSPWAKALAVPNP